LIIRFIAHLTQDFSAAIFTVRGLEINYVKIKFLAESYHYSRSSAMPEIPSLAGRETGKRSNRRAT
jgi:hypothetical protein